MQVGKGNCYIILKDYGITGDPYKSIDAPTLERAIEIAKEEVKGNENKAAQYCQWEKKLWFKNIP